MVSGTTPRLIKPMSRRDHVTGPANAPLTIVEYGDYQCPHCRLVHQNMKQLRERLGNQLRYVYRHLPISTVHPDAAIGRRGGRSCGRAGQVLGNARSALSTRSSLSKRMPA